MKKTLKEKFENQVSKDPIKIFVWLLVGFAGVLAIFLLYWLMTLGVR